MQLPDPEIFDFIEGYGMTLIVPRKGSTALLGASAWTPELRPFRSLLVDSQTYEIISRGFPKFFNYGEHPADTDILDMALKHGYPIRFTEKIDGSLCIRFVHKGEVWFRTRGTIDGGDMGQNMRAVAKKQYPSLLDPNFCDDVSMLFEFISPAFQIVISHPKDDLIWLGNIHNESGAFEMPNMERDFYQTYRHVPILTLPTDAKELLAEVADWKGREGVVAYVGQTMVKIKSAEYLLRHRLRFSLTPKAIMEICLERNISGTNEFLSYLKEQGGDWELCESAKPIVERFVEARWEVEGIYQDLCDDVVLAKIHLPTRKDYAIEFVTKHFEGGDPRRPAAFLLYDGREDMAWQALLKAEMQKALDEIKSSALAELEIEI